MMSARGAAPLVAEGSHEAPRIQRPRVPLPQLLPLQGGRGAGVWASLRIGLHLSRKRDRERQKGGTRKQRQREGWAPPAHLHKKGVGEARVVQDLACGQTMEERRGARRVMSDGCWLKRCLMSVARRGAARTNKASLLGPERGGRAEGQRTPDSDRRYTRAMLSTYTIRPPHRPSSLRQQRQGVRG